MTLVKNAITVLAKSLSRLRSGPRSGDESRFSSKLEPVPLLLPNRLLQRARIVSSREDILEALPKGLAICEVGTAYGDFAQKILDVCRPSKLIVIDTFVFHTASEPWGEVRLSGNSHIEYYKRRFEPYIRTDVMHVMCGYSSEMLPVIADKSVDVFYVDAAHNFEAVWADLSVIKYKIKDDGWIILNDYVLYDILQGVHYGVIQATNRFMVEENWEMCFLALHDYMFCDVAIRKVSH
jgi:Methyltransferase domain